MHTDKSQKEMQSCITLSEMNRLDPFAFFTGRVVQAFSAGKSKVEAADLDSFIDREKKVIKSVTKELEWDYDKGLLKIDTPACQGAVGFMKRAGMIELKDIVITSENEYASIMVISLDNAPISESKSLLIQAMTEDKLYGWKTKGNVIERLGEYPINVKNIDAAVTIKNNSSLDEISTLDGNGYIREVSKPDAGNGEIRIKLACDAIYTVASGTTEIKANASINMEKDAYTYVWWEGEDARETNFPQDTSLSASNFGDKQHLLSGSTWLANTGVRAAGQEEPFARYEIDAAKSGEYSFWVRKFWHHGPFRWKFDEGDWNICSFNIGLADSVSLNNKGACANWVNLGKVKLAGGKHTFELRLLAREGENLECGFDCFLLTTGFFAPRGKLKPGEESGLAETGFWAFEPPVDKFQESPIDLRHLNEKTAGESGFVGSKGLDFVLGNGEKVRFWAINAGPGMVRQGKSSIDYLARRLAKYGVNMVRVHGSVYDRSTDDISRIDREYLDYYHYFVHAMKQQGIYVKLSYYFPLWINMKPGYGIPGYEGEFEGKHPFALIQFNKKFQEIYKEWARKVLLTVNPYTGMPLAEDPAVAIIEVQNEDNYLFWTFGRNNIPEAQMEVLEKIFGAWLAGKYGSLPKALDTWGEGSTLEKDDTASGRMMILDIGSCTGHGHGEGSKSRRMSDQLQFLVEHQKQFYEMMMDFYKNEIGTKSLISASNWITADSRVLDPLERYTYTAADVIDRHGYFEEGHKGENAAWSVREGHEFVDLTALTHPEKAIMQINQVEGRPHIITETAWPMPNRFKGESVPMWATYGALQGMDGIFMFALGSVDWETNPIAKWPIMVPSVLGQFPAFALMYRRRDVREAETVVKVTHSLPELYDFKGAPIYETQALDELRKVQK